MYLEEHVTRIEQEGVRFGTRVAGLIVHEHHVLLQGEPAGAIWTLPGGGVKLGESSYEALEREMREELQASIHVERLLWVIEQFFSSGGTRHHEIGFYFLIRLLDAAWLYDRARIHEMVEDDPARTPIIFRWFPISALDTIPLYPQFLVGAVGALPASVTHVVLKDS